MESVRKLTVKSNAVNASPKERSSVVSKDYENISIRIE
jgi:hypothetical protein